MKRKMKVNQEKYKIITLQACASISTFAAMLTEYRLNGYKVTFSAVWCHEKVEKLELWKTIEYSRQLHILNNVQNKK